MIDNYLDWAKRRRKYCVKMAVRYGRDSCIVKDDQAKGFYRGLAMAYDYSGRNLKRLQKDIEAIKKDADFLAVYDIQTHEAIRFLS